MRLADWNAWVTEEDGATAVEYAVMLSMIIVVCIVAINRLGSTTSSMWTDNETKLGAAFNTSGSGS